MAFDDGLTNRLIEKLPDHQTHEAATLLKLLKKIF